MVIINFKLYVNINQIINDRIVEQVYKLEEQRTGSEVPNVNNSVSVSGIYEKGPFVRPMKELDQHSPKRMQASCATEFGEDMITSWELF